MTPSELSLQRLAAHHDTLTFDSGNDELDSWLQGHALAAQQMDSARTFVLARANRIVGYFSLTMADRASPITEGIDRPALRSPWRVLPEVEPSPEPLEVLVAPADVPSQQPRDGRTVRAVKPDHFAREVDRHPQKMPLRSSSTAASSVTICGDAGRGSKRWNLRFRSRQYTPTRDGLLSSGGGRSGTESSRARTRVARAAGT